ncbi:hypothetical protein BIFGAL_03223 [Bifidobacterium gallicum DSM 20093 = LMG 11596]|uniref:Uncharacterized protein n=1 Tax=Bifidobacterium gallicum DSM 20093 = LMG 11596 TaxID=561180 RepID=D1NTQ7_9BIFI|nr:hypothetical protein BIFGAL_03223 [Bifidobacterium gallicum DSM 20093 = LMG 11596]
MLLRWITIGTIVTMGVGRREIRNACCRMNRQELTSSCAMWKSTRIS